MNRKHRHGRNTGALLRSAAMICEVDELSKEMAREGLRQAQGVLDDIGATAEERKEFFDKCVADCRAFVLGSHARTEESLDEDLKAAFRDSNLRLQELVAAKLAGGKES